MTLTIPKYFTKEDLRIIGIYFLMRKGKIVYIGRTINLFERIDQHPYKKFDSVRVICCDVKRLDYYERRLISYFKPKYNAKTYSKKMIQKAFDGKVYIRLAKRAQSQNRSVNAQIIYELDQK